MSEARTHEVTTRPVLWDTASPIGAGEIAEWLVAQGVTGVDGVSVGADGRVTVALADVAQAPAAVAALDALDPDSDAALPPDVRGARGLVADVRQVVTQIEAIGPANRTPIQAALLDVARLELAVVRRLWRDAADGG